MDKESKILFGKILGEIYRLQRASDNVACSASDGQIYALLNGFESAIDDVVEQTGFIESEKIDAVIDVIDPIWIDQEKMKAFKGFYDIERELQKRGVDRADAIRVLTYLKANHQYIELIAKMDSSNSPAECRRFDISEWDK